MGVPQDALQNLTKTDLVMYEKTSLLVVGQKVLTLVILEVNGISRLNTRCTVPKQWTQSSLQAGAKNVEATASVIWNGTSNEFKK